MINSSSIYAGLTLTWGMLVALAITKTVGLSSFGEYTLVVAFASILLSLTTFRSGEILVRFADSSQKLSVSDLFLLLLLDIVPFVIGATFSWFIISYIEYNLDLLKYVVSYGVLEIFKSALMGVFQTNHRMRVFYINGSFGLACSVILLTLSFYLGQELEAFYCLQLLFIGLAISLVLNILFLIRQRFWFGGDDHKGQSILQTSLESNYLSRSWASSVVKAGNNRIEAPIIGLMLSVEYLGLYALIKQFVSPVAVFTSQLGNSNSRAVTEIALQKDLKKLEEAIKRINQSVFPLVLAVGGAGCALSQIYLLMIGADIQPGMESMILGLLILISLACSYGQWWTRPVSLATDPNISVKGNLIASALMSLGLPISILVFGIHGVPLMQATRYLVIRKYFYKRCLTVDVGSN